MRRPPSGRFSDPGGTRGQPGKPSAGIRRAIGHRITENTATQGGTMLRTLKLARFPRLLAALLGAAVAAAAILPASAAEPIKIGLGMALTGPLAANGKAALLAMQIWVEDTNAKGALLGRPVTLIDYDDQSNPSTVPGIYTKLIDVDKVDLVIGGYATNMLAPAMPVVMQHNMAFIGLLGLAVNSQFNYPKYFAMTATGGPE